MNRIAVLKKFCWIFAAGLCLVSLSAAAGGREDDLIRRATEMRKIGDDEGAAPLFQEAYNLSHSPRASAQLGFCDQALGRWPDAEIHLSEALKAGDDAWIRKNRSSIQQSLGMVKAHIARLEIVGEPVGADVLVNAVSVGQLPLKAPIRVSAGEIDVELRARGLPRVSRTLRVEGGQFQRVVLRPVAQPPPLVRPLGTASTATSAEPIQAGHPAGIDVGVIGPTESPKSAPATESGTSWRGPVKAISWGLAATSLAVGIYGVVRNDSLVSRFDKECAIDPATGPYAVAGSTDESCGDLRNQYQSAARLGMGGFIGAAVFTGVAAIVWLTAPEAPNTAARVATACTAGVTTRGEPSVSCAAHF